MNKGVLLPSAEINESCDLVGWFGIIVQIILVLLIFTAVKSTVQRLNVVKHHFESPRRILKLFFMDGAKQLSSNGLLHIINVYFSVIFGNKGQNDQCGM